MFMPKNKSNESWNDRLQAAWNNPFTQIGIGLLSTNGSNYGEPTIGRGIATGMNNYNALIEQARQRKLDEENRQREQMQWDQQQADRKAMMAVTGGVPWKVFTHQNPQLDPTEIGWEQWKNMTPEERFAAKEYQLLGQSDSRTSQQKNDAHRELLVKNHGENSERVKRFDEWVSKSQLLDAGTHYVNQLTGAVIPKNLVGEEAQKGYGQDIGNRMGGYTNAVNASYALESDIDFQMQRMMDLAGLTDGWSTGWGSLLDWIPETEAKNWKEKMSTIVANVAMGKMSELKALSATGSTGFGALSEKELKLLQDNLASLDAAQSPAEIKAALKTMLEHMSGMKKRLRTAREQEAAWYSDAKNKFIPKDQQLDSVGERKIDSKRTKPKTAAEIMAEDF